MSISADKQIMQRMDSQAKSSSIDAASSSAAFNRIGAEFRLYSEELLKLSGYLPQYLENGFAHA